MQINHFLLNNSLVSLHALDDETYSRLNISWKKTLAVQYLAYTFRKHMANIIEMFR